MPETTPDQTNSEHMTRRLDDLRVEYERGTQVLEQLDSDARETRDQLLRIAGAIRVLEELLAEQT